MSELTIPGEPPVTLHYTDSGGEGRPVVLIHGWPLSGAAWDGNTPALIAAGCRVIAYDRRGFGRSSKPEDGYDYDTFASDLNELILALDLTGAVLVGFSMGGGEVARYIGTYGTGRLAGAVFAASVTPALGLTATNPDGAMPQDAFDGLADSCAADREAFLKGFITTFFSSPNGLKVDPAEVDAALAIAAQGSDVALPASIRVWSTDFRADLAKVDVPTLVIHGDGDQNVPFAKSAARMQDIVPTAQLHVIEDGPHGINVSHRKSFDTGLVAFIESL